MNEPNLQQIRAAVARDPGNAELHYLLGAELAQQKEYEAAVVEMSTALNLDAKLHFARFQLGLLYLTMALPEQSLATWGPLESLDDGAALKHFKRGLEALIRDDFKTCIELLQQGISLNTQNAPLNGDMNLIIHRVNETLGSQSPPTVVETKPAPATSPVRTDFSLYGNPGDTKH